MEQVPLIKGINAIDLATYFPVEKVLVCSDFHFGYEEQLIQNGIFVPKQQYQLILARLESIFSVTGPLKMIVLNGDFKHEFGKTSKQEWKEILHIVDVFQKYAKKIVFIKGNHDLLLGQIVIKRGITIVPQIQIGKTLILHGDKLPKKTSVTVKTILMGHEHPAITLRENGRVERYKCYLVGKWMQEKRTYNLIVQPSFNILTEGTDVLNEKLLSPFLNQDLSHFRVFIVGDMVYPFPELCRLTKSVT